MSTTRALPSSLPTATTRPAACDQVLSGTGAWSQALARPAFCLSWLALLVLLFGIVVPLTPGFFQFIEHRPSPVLADPLLHLLPRHNVATPVFVLMYGGVLVGVGWLTRQPRLFLRGLWGYCFVLLLRMATIWLVPLSPPLDMVPMPDPFTAAVFHTGAAITKDLFFSGHTATVAILALATRGWWRRGLALAAFAIGVLVLVQRVHYTCDVVAAPVFAWVAYWLAGLLTRRATAGVALAPPAAAAVPEPA